MDAIAKLLGELAWPAVVLTIVWLLGEEIKSLLSRVREIEAPGDFKISLDEKKVEALIDRGRKQNVPASLVAQQIVQSVTVQDKRYARILRALVDDDGRAIYSYQSKFYKPALQGLTERGYVQRMDKGYALTEEGRRVTREYLLEVLKGFDRPETVP